MTLANIILSRASVEIPVFNSASRSLTNSLMSAATGGLLTTHKGGHVSIRALSEISLALNPGDRLGVIGHNGSGKSTLLRLLAGIYSPTSGTISISGTIASLMSISLGINQDNTGRENIYIRGKLMGLSKKQIDEKIEEIVAFSDLGAYIGLPVRTYSSGMALRLAFSVATTIRADIIIMDEWLSVGDETFKDRAQARLNELVDESEILVIASHSRDLIEKTCNRVLWLEHGLVKMLGDTKEVTEAYFG
jgi:lipopolysaccharide transport system ATP-binding protein